MPTTVPSPFTFRVNRIREDLRAAALDAFVVTHLPNLRYLTGFTGTAGAAIVTPERCLLIADFRYATAARELIAARPDGSIELEIPDRRLRRSDRDHPREDRRAAHRH